MSTKQSDMRGYKVERKRGIAYNDHEFGEKGLENQDAKVRLDDGVLHTLHRDLQKIGVRCVGEVNVDFSVRRLVERPEFVGEVLRRSVVVIIYPRVIRKVVFDWLLHEFLPEEINLVQEQDDG